MAELRIKRTSGGSLQRRIAAGKAEPISDRERAQLEEIRQAYIRRFGTEPDARPVAKTV